MKNLKPLHWVNYLSIYGVATLLNYMACQIAIPYFEASNLLPIEVAYFICVGCIALIPMFFMAIYLTKKESEYSDFKTIFQRMRIKKLTKSDWIFTVITFVVLCVSSFIIAKIVMPKLNIDATPFFFKNMPLSNKNMWILYIWPIFFFFNVLGEEFLWRGYIQPRQELQLGKWAWFAHGILWAFWHVPMGLDLVFVSSPIFFVLPAVVQLRQNTTIAIVVHTVFGAFGFLAIALGCVH